MVNKNQYIQIITESKKKSHKKTMMLSIGNCSFVPSKKSAIY